MNKLITATMVLAGSIAIAACADRGDDADVVENDMDTTVIEEPMDPMMTNDMDMGNDMSDGMDNEMGDDRGNDGDRT